MSTTQPTWFDILSANEVAPPIARSGLHVRTGNSGLVDARLPSAGYGSPLIVVVLDPAMPDWRWRLFDGDNPLGSGHDITEKVGTEIRRAWQKAQASR